LGSLEAEIVRCWGKEREEREAMCCCCGGLTVEGFRPVDSVGKMGMHYGLFIHLKEEYLYDNEKLCYYAVNNGK
jgi:hypothetical protein